MTGSVPTITTLGSCRVANPMRLAAADGSARLRNEGVYGYVHTAKEAVQLARYLRGGEPPPPEVEAYVAPSGRPAAAGRVPPDLYVVEISSLKDVRYGDHVLQINYMADRLADAPTVFRTVNQLYRAEQRDVRAAALAGSEEFRALEPLDRRVVLDSYIEIATEQSLERDVLELLSTLDAPAAFVTHCNVPDAEGRVLQNRQKISTWMADIAARHGLTLVDPTPIARSFGLDRALAKGGTDLSHYTEPFERMLATELLARVAPAARSHPWAGRSAA